MKTDDLRAAPSCKPAPKVSVLLPSYNYARFLPECLESVLAQDFPDLEVVVVDDASTDGSREVIERYAAHDCRIRCFFSPVNLGLVPNWNKCMAEARGEFLKVLMADDVLVSPVALTHLVTALESHPSAVMASSQSNVIDESSKPVETRLALGESGLYAGREIIIRCLEQNRNLVGEPSVVLFRKSLAASGFDPRYRQYCDTEMWMRMLSEGDLAYVAEPLCSFRRHARQLSAVNRADGVWEREELMLIERYVAQPWLDRPTARRILFSRTYQLRKQRTEGARWLAAELMGRLEPRWYWLHWLRHKAVRPLANLRRWGAMHRAASRGML